MIEVLIWLTIGVVVLGVGYAWDGAHDVFHPMMFIGAMLLFLYGWMPLKLIQANGLDGFFQIDQVLFVQTINLLGTVAFVLGCNSVGLRNIRPQTSQLRLTGHTARKLVNGALILGAVGLGHGCSALEMWAGCEPHSAAPTAAAGMTAAMSVMHLC